MMVGIPGTYEWNSILCLSLVSAFCLAVGAVAPPQMNYTVIDGDTTCTVMTAGIRLAIPYSGDLQNDTSFIDINTKATSSGQCDDSSAAESLSIHFNGDWSLSFMFGTWISEDTLSNTSYFFINQINFTYILEPNYFQRLSYDNGTQVNVLTQLPNNTLQSSIPGSYKCSTSNTLILNHGIILTMYNLQYRTFGQDNNTWFLDTDVTTCPVEGTSLPESDIQLAVAVGIALGVMILATVVLYIVISKARGKDIEENE